MTEQLEQILSHFIWNQQTNEDDDEAVANGKWSLICVACLLKILVKKKLSKHLLAWTFIKINQTKDATWKISGSWPKWPDRRPGRHGKLRQHTVFHNIRKRPVRLVQLTNFHAARHDNMVALLLIHPSTRRIHPSNVDNCRASGREMVLILNTFHLRHMRPYHRRGGDCALAVGTFVNLETSKGLLWPSFPRWMLEWMDGWMGNRWDIWRTTSGNVRPRFLWFGSISSNHHHRQATWTRSNLHHPSIVIVVIIIESKEV